MKNKIEKDLKSKAWNSVPDIWKKVEKDASDIIVEKPLETKKKINYKQIAVVAASFAVAAGCAVTVRYIRSDNVKAKKSSEWCYVTDEELTTKVKVTDENGNVTEVEGFYAYDEYSTVIIDEKGEVIGTVINTEKASADDENSAAAVSSSGSTAASTTVAETRAELGWNEKNAPEKFQSLNLYSNEYTYAGTITAGNISLLTENTEMTALDGNDKKQTAYADIYTVSGFDRIVALGVKFADNQQYPYVYVNTGYRPSTLGDMLEDLDWKNSVTYGNITYASIGSFPVSAANVNKYLLSDNSLKNTGLSPSGRYVTISVSCDDLGLYNKTMYVYESGYISTNLVGYRFTFNVGKTAVADFLKACNNITFDEIYSARSTDNTVVNGTTADSTEEE